MSEPTTIPLSWAATALGTAGTVGTAVFKWWASGLQRQHAEIQKQHTELVARLEAQNKALTDELKEMTRLLSDMKQEMGEQRVRIEYLTTEVERLRRAA